MGLGRRTPRTDTCLAVAVGGSEVGLALLTRERLLDDDVLNVRKLPTPEGREHKFRHRVEAILDEGRVTVLLAVTQRRSNPTMGRQLTTLDHLARARGLPLLWRAAADLRAVAQARERAKHSTNLVVARQACTAFPELACRLDPNAGDRERNGRDRYHARVFLAVLAGTLALEERALADAGAASSQPV